MCGTSPTKRRSTDARVADQGWRRRLTADGTDGLVSPAGEAGGPIGPAVREAQRRAVRAFHALAGRRPAPPWALLASVGVIGAVIGWAAGTAARAIGSRAEPGVDDIELVDIGRTDSPIGLDGCAGRPKPA